MRKGTDKESGEDITFEDRSAELDAIRQQIYDSLDNEEEEELKMNDDTFEL